MCGPAPTKTLGPRVPIGFRRRPRARSIPALIPAITRTGNGDHLPHPRPSFHSCSLFSFVLYLCLQNTATRPPPRCTTHSKYPIQAGPRQVQVHDRPLQWRRQRRQFVLAWLECQFRSTSFPVVANAETIPHGLMREESKLSSLLPQCTTPTSLKAFVKLMIMQTSPSCIMHHRWAGLPTSEDAFTTPGQLSVI
jgi:hypothetical protein